MKYIINKLRTFFTIRTMLYILLLSFIVSLGINYFSMEKVHSEISIIDQDKTETSRIFTTKLASLDEFTEDEVSGGRTYIILEGFEQKIKNQDYKALVDIKKIDQIEMEKANLKLLEVIAEHKVINEIKKENASYTQSDYYKDIQGAVSYKLVDIKDNPIDARVDITDKKRSYAFVVMVLFMFLSNMYVNVEIIKERECFILDRLIINGIAKYYYYIEKFLKVLLINLIFLVILLLVTGSVALLNVSVFIAILELFIYSIALHLLKLDKNSYIVIYMIFFIVLSILYIIPGVGISYFSPIEIIALT